MSGKLVTSHYPQATSNISNQLNTGGFTTKATEGTKNEISCPPWSYGDFLKKTY